VHLLSGAGGRGMAERDFSYFSYLEILGELEISLNIGDKESSSDLETGAEPHRLELEEEFGEFLQEIPLYPLLSRGSGMKWSESLQGVTEP
jgi:hypothetical protein